jgi:hypothetical protein
MSIDLLMQNGSTSLVSGGVAGISSMFLLPSGVYRVPYIEYDMPLWSMYGLSAMMSASSVNLSGDFVFPLISGGNPYLAKLNKISRPISVGMLSLIVLYVLNGFYVPDVDQAGKFFLLNATSYMIGDYVTNSIFQNAKSYKIVDLNKPEDKPATMPQMSLREGENPFNYLLNRGTGLIGLDNFIF